MSDILTKLAALREHPKTTELREHIRRGYGFVACGASSRTWTLSNDEIHTINVGFEAADNRSRSLIALVQEAAAEIERLRRTLAEIASSHHVGNAWAQDKAAKALNSPE